MTARTRRTAGPKPTAIAKPLTRVSFLAIRGVIVFAAAAAVWTTLGQRLANWASGAPLTWTTATGSNNPPAAPDAATMTQLSPKSGVVLSYPNEIVWSVVGAAPQSWLLSVSAHLAGAVTIVLGAVVLWRLVGDAQAGRPFVPGATSRISLLGGLCLAYGTSVPLLGFAADLLLTFTFTDPPNFYARLESGYLMPAAVGVLLLVLGEIYRQGSVLSRDVDGLI